MADVVIATRIADGAYRVDHDGRSEIVYVAGSTGDLWAFWNGQVFRSGRPEVLRPPEATPDTSDAPARARVRTVQPLTAPMPATVAKILVTPGSAVRKGDTLVLLEAMKMELPIRAPADATVVAVHCREGELVQPDTTLVELE